ncbi:MAG TPA: hypothetical protein VN666_18630 [Nitrospira sp.]|nr:hypothetical protein [Nitrospira sp.]
MASELWFFFTTVLVCTGYALLLHTYSQWKIYFSIGLVVFVICGAVLVYFDANEREEDRIKIRQTEHALEEAKKEIQKQESLTRDAADKARLLAEQLKKRTDELATVLKDKPQIGGEIIEIRIFPWRHGSASRTRTDDSGEIATGVLVFSRVENRGSSTTLANWELTITLPDSTVVKPQKWPIQQKMRIPCEDGPVNISKNQFLDLKSRQALQRNEERSGVIVWMLSSVPPDIIRTKDSFYTLTARDNTGVTHALERYDLASLPQKCFGFDVQN